MQSGAGANCNIGAPLLKRHLRPIMVAVVLANSIRSKMHSLSSKTVNEEF